MSVNWTMVPGLHQQDHAAGLSLVLVAHEQILHAAKLHHMLYACGGLSQPLHWECRSCWKLAHHDHKTAQAHAGAKTVCMQAACLRAKQQ